MSRDNNQKEKTTNNSKNKPQTASPNQVVGKVEKAVPNVEKQVDRSPNSTKNKSSNTPEKSSQSAEVKNTLPPQMNKNEGAKKTEAQQIANKAGGNKNQNDNNSVANNNRKVNDISKSPVTNAIAPEKKKGTWLVPVALLAGMFGTGFGVYNYDQIRRLSATDTTGPLIKKLQELETQVATLSQEDKNAIVDPLKVKIAEIDQSLQSNKEKFNQRLSAIEQMQNGLTTTLQGDVQQTLDKRLDEVNTLLSKVDQIELTQKSLSQNLTQAVSAGEAVTAEGMAKQEIGYLLRMADYKVQSEGDVNGAAGLLEIAERKLLLLNEGQTDNMVESIRQNYIRLRGVKRVDSNALIRNLRTLSAIIPNLQAKPVDMPVKNNEVAVEGKSDSFLGKVGQVIASGVKYTPNDPNRIDVSAETVLIEKRLMQADIRTAELAIRSQNGVLLAETINSIRSNLEKYFAADETEKTIQQVLTKIEAQKLDTVLPDLSKLVNLYEAR